MIIEDSLKKNIKEFIDAAEDELMKGRYNIAATSYFKAIVTLCDLKIYRLRRILPKNHSERFIFLRTFFPKAYKVVSSLFNTYTKTYNLRLSRKDAILFKKNVEKLKRVLTK